MLQGKALAEKYCIGCEETYPRTKDFFYFTGRHCQTRCKKCHGKVTKERIDKVRPMSRKKETETIERNKIKRKYERLRRRILDD